VIDKRNKINMTQWTNRFNLIDKLININKIKINININININNRIKY